MSHFRASKLVPASEDVLEQKRRKLEEEKRRDRHWDDGYERMAESVKRRRAQGGDGRGSGIWGSGRW